MDAWSRLWRSVGFRLAFYYGMLVAVTMLAALGVLHLQTVGVMQQRTAQQLNQSVRRLSLIFETGGLSAVATNIQNALDEDRESDGELYLLTDAEGKVRAGNLDQMPGVEAGVVQRKVSRRGHIISAQLSVVTLGDGSVLAVGRDRRDQEAIEALVENASAAASLVGLLLLIGGTFIFRQTLESSVGEIRRTAERIAAGDLARRVPVSGQDDEFAKLTAEFNNMLDRVQMLMDGVRHVSDAIAHNLRTPLTRILLGLRAVEQGSVDEAQRLQAVSTAIREIEDLTVVFEKLLQIAEAEAGARRQQFSSIALHHIADDVAELYDAVAEQQGTTLTRRPAEPTLVLGDRDLLAGAIVNLVDNALKYAGAGAVVNIGTERLADRAVLTVRDNGAGVPAHEIATLGRRFHRLDRSQTGHGLGLTSVQAVTALHGGQLLFEDAKPGLMVRIELPLPGNPALLALAAPPETKRAFGPPSPPIP